MLSKITEKYQRLIGQVIKTPWLLIRNFWNHMIKFYWKKSYSLKKIIWFESHLERCTIVYKEKQYIEKYDFWTNRKICVFSVPFKCRLFNVNTFQTNQDVHLLSEHRLFTCMQAKQSYFELRCTFWLFSQTHIEKNQIDIH